MRRDIVLEMGAVGGADLDQPGAGAGHDVGHAEGAADLDQLAARDDRLAPLGQGVEHQQHGGGVVVDDGRVLGAGQLAQQAAQMIVALAALAAVEVELERDRVAHGVDRGLDRRLGQQRAAEIGVQHGAGQVEDRAQAGHGLGLQPPARAVRDRLRRSARCRRCAQRRAHRARRSRPRGGRTCRSPPRPRPSAAPRRPRAACARCCVPIAMVSSRPGTGWRRRAGTRSRAPAGRGRELATSSAMRSTAGSLCW